MKLQELFDKSVLGLRKQGVVAVKPGTTECMYRTPEGNKCAAGMMIPDEKYDAGMEGNGINNSKRVRQAIGIETGTELDLVAALQRSHDMAAYRVFYADRHKLGEPVRLDQRWLEECQQIANDFGLDESAVTTPLPPS